MRKKVSIFVFVLAVALMVTTGLVMAQNSSGTDFTADKIQFNYKKNATTFWGSPEKPVSVQMDRYVVTAPFLEYYQDTGKVIASGGVRLVGEDPSLELVCERLEADEQQILASGKVAFTFEDLTGTGEKLIYLPLQDEARLEGKPTVTTTNGSISGAVIQIDLAGEVITASGGSQMHLQEVEQDQ